ncbi:inositol-3-phosphate synthase [Streptomyces sp. NBC_01320]|uniref:inositol-3-phosphate synthase n=1 Tax=Streptomyces sp. NBC_01320 TaxID=2903824 RepID=UPI003FA34DB1
MRADDDRPQADAADRLTADLIAFRERHALDTVVVIDVSSTEPPPVPHPAHESLARLERALHAGRTVLPPAPCTGTRPSGPAAPTSGSRRPPDPACRPSTNCPPVAQAGRCPCLVGTTPGPACVQRPGPARCAPLLGPVSGQYRVSSRAFGSGAGAPPWETSCALR